MSHPHTLAHDMRPATVEERLQRLEAQMATVLQLCRRLLSEKLDRARLGRELTAILTERDEE